MPSSDLRRTRVDQAAAPKAPPSAETTIAAPALLLPKLAKLGLRTPLDLVLHLPLRYEDETQITLIEAARDGEAVLIEAEVVRCEVAFRPRRQLVAHVRDDSGNAVLRFFNFFPSQQKALAPGVSIRAFGELRGGFFGAEMVHPRFRVVREGEPLPAGLTPVYPTTAGVGQYTLRTLIARVLERVDLGDTLPAAIVRGLKLDSFESAIRLLHAPPPGIALEALSERVHPAWTRIKFDELLGQQLSMRVHYRARAALVGPALSERGKLIESVRKRLPFSLTAAQERAWSEISADLAAPRPMHRLLQGDVGSGKTIVAVFAALRAVENGYQATVMAPTEILAEQHFKKFAEWLVPLGVSVAWLSGSQKKSVRKQTAAGIASGEIQVAIGTHALFQDDVHFARLAVTIVDEQHRFGVKQRLALREKGGRGEPLMPHQLMMSATPIPRTLAMGVFADLDISTIDELPPGRTPVRTKLIADSRRHEVIERMREACDAGHQVYWVCPLIEESETLDLQTAIDTHAALSAELAGVEVGLVHGRLPGPEKAEVMERFVAGKTSVLVATTVIEVGVDVPNASLMVIEHAERFGLAQLHQLRGRVGRGAAESVCILLYQSPLSEGARARLKVIYESSDGFKIAQADLEQRGPGEVLGARQSGVPMLRFADLARDQDLLERAQALAERMLDTDPEHARAHLARWMAGRSELLKA